MVDINPAWIALVGTVFGGAGLKMTESWLNRSTRHDHAAKAFRDEQRIEISGLRTELEKAEAAADQWREKYWQLRAEYAKVQTDYMKVQSELQAALTQLKKRIKEIDPGP